MASLDRSALDRVVVFTNRKGGVAKTALATNLAWNAANEELDQLKVLIVDLDPQATVSLEMGCRSHPDLGYRAGEPWVAGEQFRHALETGEPLRPIPQIRPNLDLVTADPSWYHDRPAPRPGQDEWDMLVEPLSAVADNYDLIIIDTNPGVWELSQMALGVGRYVVFPFQPDISSIEGLPFTYGDIVLAQQHNPELEMLMFILVFVGQNHTRQQKEAFAALRDIGVDEALISKSVVPYNKGAATYGRNRGILPAEALAEDTGKPWWWYAKQGKEVPYRPGTQGVAHLAEALGMIASEILFRISTHEEKQPRDTEEVSS